MRTLHVITHPEATHHVARTVGGWHDSALTPDGLRDARHIARALRRAIPEDTDVELFTSDLLRTRQTTTPIAEVLGVQPELNSRLREKSYGEAEGRPKAWLAERFAVPPAEGERLWHDEGVKGAEMKGDWARRVYAAMAEITQRPCAQQVVVTHGGTLTFVVAAWIGMPVESVGRVSFPVPAGSITTLTEDDYFHNRQVTSLGDTRHLLRRN
ncbi:histidine phosphatase family protein [Streptomyces roseirectus]|uniref:Histidine phosphatase family protein n=1 Tax=Streptomyces roseirectus TaxID=2768066 RepID=A0A7H0I6G7_9ACTN|nr:histidine phosphatase family protein [Streptomyces roseirectus]QNP68383.1 histidine phosphatase family protein [Streptomyces roseirectus]